VNGWLGEWVDRCLGGVSRWVVSQIAFGGMMWRLVESKLQLIWMDAVI
jgi:hypothetical protein